MTFSMAATACGPPNPRKAVLDGRFVRQTVPLKCDVGYEVGVLGVKQRAFHHGQRQVGGEAAVGVEVGFQGVMRPSFVKPASKLTK